MADSTRDGGAPHVLWVNQFAVTPADGGGTRHYELARELVERGWRVTVAASDFDLHRRVYRRRRGPDDRAAVREMVDGVEFLWLWSAPYTRNDLRRVRNWLSFASSLRAGVAGTRPAAVIGSSPQLFAALAASEVARRAGAPFLLEVRDLWPESLAAVGGSKGVVYAALAAVARLLYRRSRRTIVLTRGVGDYLATRGWVRDEPVYVPNGIDPAGFPPRAPRADGDTFTLVYAGAHGPANGLDVVLEAAALLRHERGRRRSGCRTWSSGSRCRSARCPRSSPRPTRGSWCCGRRSCSRSA
jgi:glycosyltransferase involved in cell wall biosynthesis